MAENDMNAFLDNQEIKEEPKRKRRKKGTGDVVCITLRLSPTQWRNAHNLALSEGVSINELAITGINRLLEDKGLQPLE